MKRDGACISIWQPDMPEYKTLNNVKPDEVFDVIIAGGGITGITTALMLQKAGKKCLVAEAHSLCFGTTGGTTAHLNTLMDNPYNLLSKNFGEDKAALVAAAAREAIETIKQHIQTYSIECSFKEMSAWLFSQTEKQTRELEDIQEATNLAGEDMKPSDCIPVPIPFEKAFEIKDQAQFHPAQYVYALAKEFEKAGGVILQQCRVLDSEKDEEVLHITTSSEKLTARHLIYATHIPPGINVLHLRCAPYRSYVMAVKLADGKYPQGLAYDMMDPYHYFRTQSINGEDYLIVGGEDHKTAHNEHTESSFAALEAYTRRHFNVSDIPFRWSSQYFEPADGLPYIGHLPGNPENVYVATGFGGNGMIYGTIAAITLAELITSGSSRYEDLFKPARIKPVAGFTNFVKENADVAAELVGKWFAVEKLEAACGIAPGEGKVVKFEGQAMALYKDEHHALHAVNPACTHMSCSVSWNTTEKSWDCPCHGARYSSEGNVLTGPAVKGLEKINLEEKSLNENVENKTY